MTGYELAGYAERSIGNFFPLTRSHIYSELERLGRLGLLEATEIAQETAPTKRVHEITPAGSDELQRWLEGTMMSEGRSRNLFLVRIFFGDRTTPERLAALLDEFELAARFRRDQLASIVEKLADRPESVFRRSTAMFGLRREQANLDWVAEVRPMLLAAAAAGALNARPGRLTCSARWRTWPSAIPAGWPLLALAAFVVAGVFGGTAIGLLNARNPFSDPSSASARAEAAIQRATGEETSPGVLALVSAPPGSPAVTSAAHAIAHVPGVAVVTAPAPGHQAGLVSADGRSSLVAATLRAAPDPDTVVRHIETALHGRPDVLLGGGRRGRASRPASRPPPTSASRRPLPSRCWRSSAFFIFRGIAALLPIAVGGMAVLGTFLVLRLVNAVLPLSIFALNLVIGLGLGLAVDYSLFLVWRFREELRRDADAERALRVTLATTGRTILFSAATVAAALASLTVFPQRFLVSMGLGGAIVAIVAAASALLIVPSLLMLLSRRIGRVKPPAQTGGWYRLANGVMRRPALVAARHHGAAAGDRVPGADVRWSGIDATVLPASQSARVVTDTVARDFPPSNDANAILVVASAPASAQPALASYAIRLGRLPGITQRQRAGPARPRDLGNQAGQPG